MKKKKKSKYKSLWNYELYWNIHNTILILRNDVWFGTWNTLYKTALYFHPREENMQPREENEEKGKQV